MSTYARTLPMLAIPALLTLAGGPSAAGTCTTGDALSGNDIFNAFNGKTITFNCEAQCDGWMASTTTDWHEQHVTPALGSGTPGDLIEIGTGPGGIQPTETVGTWTVVDNTIFYQYDGVASGYLYAVDKLSGTLGASGSTYAFCFDPGTGLTSKATGTID